MHTNDARTRTASVPASPAATFAYLADPLTLPAWAPDFASSVRLHDDAVLVTQGDAEFAIRVVTSSEHGTVDLVSPADPTLGAFLRVLPNGEGSEVLFTLFFGPDVPDDAIATQMATVDEELATVARVLGGCERPA